MGHELKTQERTAAPESGAAGTLGSFFKQSAWMGVATVLGGVFMVAVHSVRMERTQYEVFSAMLRAFLLLGIPSAGLQITFARQSAAAVRPEDRSRLAATVRRVLAGIGILWLALLVAVFLGREAIAGQLRLGDGRALWPTLGVGLMWLLLPVLRGLLQGSQDFAILGWVAILDGFLRFSLILVCVAVLHLGAAGALTGVLLAMGVTTGIAFWRTRPLWTLPGAAVDWGAWSRHVLPFTLGAGSLLVLANADVLYLQAIIPESEAERFQQGDAYTPAAMIGFALVQFTGQLAVVMFPKIARSVAGGERTDALTLAFLGTLILGALAVGFVCLFPALPLRIVFFTRPDALAAAPIVPWHTAAMVLFTLANVLVANLLAQGRMRIIPWAVGIALLYAATLYGLRNHLPTLQPVLAYRLMPQIIGGCSLALLLVAAWMTWGRNDPIEGRNIEH
ncbi:MAG: hypothetical protein KIT22_08655 [Verrucomicrobiae bacterium]|nr:hypothetical protein [Verrucomicrobiae bacterium]